MWPPPAPIWMTTTISPRALSASKHLALSCAQQLRRSSFEGLGQRRNRIQGRRGAPAFDEANVVRMKVGKFSELLLREPKPLAFAPNYQSECLLKVHACPLLKRAVSVASSTESTQYIVGSRWTSLITSYARTSRIKSSLAGPGEAVVTGVRPKFPEMRSISSKVGQKSTGNQDPERCASSRPASAKPWKSRHSTA